MLKAAALIGAMMRYLNVFVMSPVNYDRQKDAADQVDETAAAGF